ncbi:MAG: 6-phosphofructokinase [Myxococcales bacterium]
MNTKIRSGKRALAVLTSGGDAPGMNAAVRAVVRAGIEFGMDVWGIERGYAGMLEGQFVKMDQGSVGNIIQRGGTVLRTARSEEFMSKAGRAKGARELSHRDIDTLVAIGGDGTFRGAALLADEHGIKVIGVPGTIDNDVSYTDATIGYDTAVNTAIDAIDRIRDTAAAHDRFFVIEVMGRASGHIAIDVGIACGAEAIVIPEYKKDISEIAHKLERGKARGKTSSILIAAEGKKAGDVYALAAQLGKRLGVEMRVAVLGHIQRGGSPTARDRILATRMGAAAAKAAFEGRSGVMIGEREGRIVEAPLDEVTRTKKKPELDLYELADVLSR